MKSGDRCLWIMTAVLWVLCFAAFVAFATLHAAPPDVPPAPAPPAEEADAPSATLGTPKPLSRPAPGVCFDGEIISVHDGDTLTFRVTTDYRVRLADCWAPELKDKGGIASRDKLADMAVGRRGRMFIDFKKSGVFGDEMSFERVVGRVWTADDESDLSSRMVRSGHATERNAKPAAKDIGVDYPTRPRVPENIPRPRLPWEDVGLRYVQR